MRNYEREPMLERLGPELLRGLALLLATLLLAPALLTLIGPVVAAW
ncbi:MAG: hypothetical protein ABFS30_13880 [Pseudomonadota bacterium]